MEPTTILALPSCAEPEYRPFPNKEGRDARQATIEVPLMVRALDLPTGGRVLEVGCGRGVALPGLARLLRPSHLAALDIEPSFLEEARARLDAEGIAAELVPGDIRRMPFPDASFDMVVDFGTCYHIARATAALAEIGRVLAPDGLFVHETPVSQLLSHPVRAFGRRLPWSSTNCFKRHRTALLWSARRRG